MDIDLNRLKIKKLTSSSAGFTLVEVLVATIILSIALIGIMTGINAAIGTQKNTNYMAGARDTAIEQLDTYRSYNEATLIAQPTPNVWSVSHLPRGNSVTLTWSKYPNGASTHMYRATVVVAWPEGNGTRSITYDTLLYKK